jgi:hypothetical protein
MLHRTLCATVRVIGVAALRKSRLVARLSNFTPRERSNAVAMNLLTMPIRAREQRARDGTRAAPASGFISSNLVAARFRTRTDTCGSVAPKCLGKM